MRFISYNQNETEDFARQVASFLEPGDILALHGDLGAGKTTFTRALAKNIGVSGEVTSPTFVIQKNYKVKSDLAPENLKGMSEFVHVDCYRFSGNEDAFSVGMDEYFSRKDTIMVIEWPERIADILPQKTKMISFTYLDENEREIEAKWIKG